MNIELHEILIKDLAENYEDAGEKGVTGYNGRLNIRPAYQREFVYKDKQRSAVIETVKKDFPLNVMYWVKNSDDNFEVLDGQQRTISICEFIIDKFSIEFEANKTQYFGNLTNSEKEQILNYKLMIYFCEGNDKEKLDWFKTINIAGEKLYDQELRNAIYTGPWLHDAKGHFSRNGCVANSLGKDYLTGSSIRQDYLQTAISWINNGKIEEYMAQHQHDRTANELWTYFQSVITWVKSTFPNYRSVMKGVDWGTLYNKFKNDNLDPQTLEEKISVLMKDEDVENKKGIYFYVLDGEEKNLNIRAFSENMKREAYERQNKKCANPKCPNNGKEFAFEEMEGDHIDPWHTGGKTTADNCQMLCKPCNRRKSGS
jgi:hypothetical protein